MKFRELKELVPNAPARSMGNTTLSSDNEVTLEWLRPLKPFILSKWMRALNTWAAEEYLPQNIFEPNYLGNILENIFCVIENSCSSELVELDRLRPGDMNLKDAVNCRLHESICIGLYKTGKKIIVPVLNSYHNFKINGHVLNDLQSKDLIKNAFDVALHLEIEGCGRRRACLNCRFT